LQFAAAHGITEDAVTAFLHFDHGGFPRHEEWGRYDRMRRSHTLAGTRHVRIFAKDMKVAPRRPDSVA